MTVGRSVHVTWEGMDHLLRGLTQAGSDVGRDVAQAIQAEGQLVFRESQREVPYATGALRSSGRLDGPHVNGSRIELEITYGGTAASYAGFVHEIDKNYNHGKKWHYLSDPVERAAPQMGQRVAARLADFLRRKIL